MDFTFHIVTLRDAILARAALEAITKVGIQQQNLDPEEVKRIRSDDVGIDTLIGGEPLMNLGGPLPGAAFTVPVNYGADQSKDREPAESADKVSEFTKDQIKAAAAQQTDQGRELAALISKKGRKSADEQAKINSLTAAILSGQSTVTVERPVGEALKGATAEELQAALMATTKPVVSEPGIEVRTLPETTTGLAAIDPDLAAIAAAGKTQEQPPVQTEAKGGDDLASLSDADLYQKIQAYAEGGAGLFWFKNVVDQGGGNMSKLPRDHMLKVLANPDAFYPAR